ncbi:hypothetical protein SERLA73DRAFT_73992 [Serpula lacrymans var. lacrymans S7.3]|uniref:CCHC-type domain-containing protein n=2 Tax=Serpula lacrymans var. lacrymans TaxID=341189 RepID=F8PXE0_SERL3|nr:uncharacterized protein SERLADRAFT_438629 [Serpula lacrymans var. lacrymans S7.9]EGN99466.1 hypothetical protein SERLA73DRAFT_73992 [Serpula lacrymans var. lacrymans S7.3]EGO25021.1 hypothetical protein SERLADRAFT_438629 [Serpula lacrymans var. lacrymans S7.9]
MASGSSGSGNRGPNGWYQGEGASEKKAETMEEKKDGTGTTYGGASQRIEVDKAKYRAEGRCFKCGEKGHRAQDHKEGGSAAAKPKFNLRAMPAVTSRQTEPKDITNVNRYASLPVDDFDACKTDENETALFKDAQNLKQKEQSKEESLRGKRAEKIPKTETTKIQNGATQLGSASDTDTLTRSEEVRHTSDKSLEAARKVPKGDRTMKSAAKKETTEVQNAVTQLGSTNDTDTTTGSKVLHTKCLTKSEGSSRFIKRLIQRQVRERSSE